MSAGDDSSLKAVLVAVVVNAFITVAKYTGFFLTASPALLAEAIHSTADVGNQVLMWVGLRQSAKEADEEHPYGWGPARYLWNLKSAMGIFFLGCGVTVYHGVSHLMMYIQGHGHVAENTADAASDSSGLIGIGILVLAFVLESFSLWVAVVGIKKQKGETSWGEFISKGDDPTGVGILLEDSAAVLGVVLALIGVVLTHFLHNPLPDIIATLVIGALLGVVAIFLAKANGRLLIGASISPAEIKRIKDALEADEIVEKVVDLKTEVLGQGRMRVKCEVDLYEKLMARRMRESLKDDAQQLERGDQEPMKVLVDVVGRTIRVTGKEIERLEQVIRRVAPTAVHIDLELI